jgi:hypothetical protein
MSRCRKTDTLRVDPEFKEWVKEMSRMKSFQEKDKIDASRITQAVFNLRKKYPIDDEIKLSKLGKWKGQ